MPRPGKKQLNVFLTEESFHEWRAFCDEHGVSVTALIEAIGRALPELPARPSGFIADAIREARRVDSQRRRGE